MYHDPSEHQEPLGTILGYAPGNVAVYSCNYEKIIEDLYPDRHSFRHYVDGVYMGYKWQCVELARRWLYINHGYVFADVAMAYDIFRLHSVRTVKGNQVLPLYSFPNGCRRLPEVGSMLIWEEGGMFEDTGHVAIITEVKPDHVLIVEQNVYNHKWPEGQSYSRKLQATIDEHGGYSIKSDFENSHILGWVIQTENAEHALPASVLDGDAVAFSLKQTATAAPAESKWLDESNPDEQAYVKSNGFKLANDRFFTQRYITITESMHKEIKRAANELHAMFLQATDLVLEDESLQSRFNIPDIIWPRIRKSWANRTTETIVGRLDLAVGEHGIKCYEYNADSASCLMECGKIQGSWANTYCISEGEDAGKDLFQQLVYAWKKNKADGVLHILLDDDSEETYHARYMQSAAEKAGIQCKFLKGLAGVQWGPNNSILDSDGIPITKVWKTWAWETALDQIRDQLDQDDVDSLSKLTQANERPPRLADILLNPRVMVHEPLWTLVPSNKAILPILSDLFPESPYLLESSYELTDTLKARGYVEKPIVGRCGSNIVLYDPENDVLEKTKGKFKEQDTIYQALCPLPTLEGYYVQTNAFLVDGKYSGACLRVDQSPIITGNSDLPALRIIDA